MTRTAKVGLLVITLCLAAGGQASAEANRSAPPQCFGHIQPNQAWVYLQPGYSSPCYSLEVGTTDPWTAWDAAYGLPNDAIKSIKTGSGVTLVLFWNNFYTRDNGATLSFPPNSAVRDLGSWNGKASAARVQTFASNSACSVSGDALLALFTDQDFQGDCNVLTVGARCYSDPFDMGFRNDTLSSLYNASTLVPNLYVDSFFLTLWSGIPPGFADNLGPYGANDFVSSASGDRSVDCRR